MLVPEEDIAALEAEVAELLGILEMLPAVDDDGSDEEGIVAGIRRYADQVERVGLAAGNAGFFGLRDVCLLFQENLANSDFRQQGLGDVMRERLEEWPILAIGYLGDPSDLQSSESLIEHLRSPVWISPISAEESSALRDMLTCGALALDATDAVDGKSADVEEEAEVTASSSVLATVSVEPESMLQQPLTVKIMESAMATPAIAVVPEQMTAVPEAETEIETVFEIKPVALPELTEAAVAVTLAEAPAITAETVAMELAPSAEVFTEQEVPAVREEPGFGEAEEPESEPADEESESINGDVAVGEIISGETEQEVTAVQEELLSDEAEEEESTDEDVSVEEITSGETEEPELEPADQEDEEPAGAVAGASDAGQELLDILCAEIAQIVEDADEVMAVATAADSASTVRSEALSGYAEHLERLGDASGSIGLTGLQQVCASLQNNLNHLAAQDHPLTADQREAVQIWPDLALNYLRALNDRPTCAALANHLGDIRWPQPLAIADVDLLIERLAAAKLVTEEAETETRPHQATVQDVSIQLPADVNPELLDGLLQELPNQAAEFSASIQRLAAGDGTLKDVDVARRIAHTLKGAGNTVGVRGIATLTHQVEDILQALATHEALPNRPLAETLLNAADCLETMSEALLGMSAPPPQAQAVLQEVLDWANRIDRTGIPAGEEAPPPARARPESVAPADTAAIAPPAPATVAEAALRIPAHLVDDLLRLVGENIILTGQIQERVRKTIAQTRAVMGQNRLFQQLTSELEQLVDIRNVSSPLSRSIQRGDFDPLELEQYNELNTATHRLVEAATDNRELDRAIADSLVALDTLLVDQSRLHRESQEAVLRTRMVPIQTIAPRLQRSVRQTCRLVDKEVELTVRGADTLMDSNVLNGIVDPLMHILRNAVDHGIEPPAQRQRLGKPPVGRIELSVLREGNAIVIRCQDDGAGLDLTAIRQTAVERGLLSADKSLEEDELARLILLPGFSTRGATTQTSGRGIGMDMVYSRLLDMKGALRIQTRSGQGCLMELRLPVTLISTHALLVRIHDRLYALSDRGIEQILYSGIGTIQKLGKATTYHLGNDIYDLTTLETLLNLPPDRRTHARAAPPVLLVREETGAIRAVLVSEAVDSRDLVVKPLGQYVPKLNGVVGATILGDGSVAPVLDLPELLRAPSVLQQTLTFTHQQPAPAAPAAVHHQVALAVDDSLSARRSLAQFVQDAGFEVRTARDGLEAIEIINGKRPDIVLADLEMPRMNGLELTAHLRANQPTRDLPVIMITSRSTDKHRREAEAMGVNVYLTKPFAEDELLGYIKKLLQRP